MKLFIFLAVSVLTTLISCGVEEFAYLEPVSIVNPDSSDSLKVKVKLPSDADQTEYFDEYILYYKIFTTETEATENSLIASNNDSIDDANENPATIDTVLKNLNFKEISFGSGQSADDDFKQLINPLSIVVDSNINGQTFTLDFNLDSLGKNYPIMSKEDGTTYKLMRTSEFTYVIPSDQDLTYHDFFDTKNDYEKDYAGINGKGYAHVLLYILASGHDFNMLSLQSTATKIGVFLLKDRDQ